MPQPGDPPAGPTSLLRVEMRGPDLCAGAPHPRPWPLVPTLLLGALAGARLTELWSPQQVPEGWGRGPPRVLGRERPRGLARLPIRSRSGGGLVKQACGARPVEREEREGVWACHSSRGCRDAGVIYTVTHSFHDFAFIDSGVWQPAVPSCL